MRAEGRRETAAGLPEVCGAIPVTEVTVFEDRALVVRRGQISLPAGRCRLRVDGVAPVLVDKTLLGRVGEGAAVLGATVERQLVTRLEDHPPDQAAVLRELEEVTGLLADLDLRLALKRRQLEQLDQIGRQTLAELAEDAAWGQLLVVSEQRERQGLLAAEEQSQRRAVLDLEEEQDELEERRVDLEQRRATGRRGPGVLRAAACLELECAAAGDRSVELEYVVPAACWRPIHRAELLPTDDRLRWCTDGVVWQRTGEDWESVELHLSTRRASLGLHPPELESDRLRMQPRAAETEVTLREEEIQTIGLASERRQRRELPGIDDGGEPLALHGEERATVPSDGRPYRVRLGSAEMPTEHTRVLIAELTEAVILRSEQRHGSAGPLLPGPVELVRRGGPCGWTTVRFVAAGERFALGWGPDPDLRVARRLDIREENRKTLGVWASRHHQVTLQLSNLGTEQRDVEVVERVPVSELESVQVQVDTEGTTDGARPDDDGFLRWPVSVPANGQLALELRYRVRWRREVASLG